MTMSIILEHSMRDIDLQRIGERISVGPRSQWHRHGTEMILTVAEHLGVARSLAVDWACAAEMMGRALCTPLSREGWRQHGHWWCRAQQVLQQSECGLEKRLALWALLTELQQHKIASEEAREMVQHASTAESLLFHYQQWIREETLATFAVPASGMASLAGLHPTQCRLVGDLLFQVGAIFRWSEDLKAYFAVSPPIEEVLPMALWVALQTQASSFVVLEGTPGARKNSELWRRACRETGAAQRVFDWIEAALQRLAICSEDRQLETLRILARETALQYLSSLSEHQFGERRW